MKVYQLILQYHHGPVKLTVLEDGVKVVDRIRLIGLQVELNRVLNHVTAHHLYQVGGRVEWKGVERVVERGTIQSITRADEVTNGNERLAYSVLVDRTRRHLTLFESEFWPIGQGEGDA